MKQVTRSTSFLQFIDKNCKLTFANSKSSSLLLVPICLTQHKEFLEQESMEHAKQVSELWSDVIF